MNSSQGFFHRSETLQATLSICNLDHLTIYAGAGVSIDQGSVDWNELLRVMLIECMEDSPGPPDSLNSDAELHAVASALVDEMGPAAAASIVRTHYVRKFPDAAEQHLRNKIFSILYSNWDPTEGLGSAISKLALYASAAGVDVHVVTPNYDDNIETALASSSVLQKFSGTFDLSFVRLSRPPRQRELATGEIPVVHIHGYIPQSAGDNAAHDERLIFSERDNYKAGSTSSSAGSAEVVAYLANRMQRGSFLFVGTTLRDPDVIQALELARLDRRGKEWPTTSWPWVISPVPDDQTAISSTQRMLLGRSRSQPPARPIADLIAAGVRARMDHLQVRVIRPDHYGQVSQFIHELALCVPSPDAYYETSSYSKRLKSWEKFWDSEWKRRVAAEGPGDQIACETAVLVGMSSQMRGLVDEFFDRPTFEAISQARLEFWIRDRPSSRKIVLWCSSDSVLVDARNRPAVHLTRDTSFAAVKAFAARNRVLSDIDPKNNHGKWGKYLAVPVIHDSKQFSDLPVGAVVLLLSGKDGQAIDLRDPATGIDCTNTLAAEMSAIGRTLIAKKRTSGRQSGGGTSSAPRPTRASRR